MQLQQPSHLYKARLRVTRERLAVAVALLLGAALRLAHLAFIDLGAPFHLGGLFVEFSRQIAAAGYRLPPRIPFYTAGGIPFAYPPLPFYVEALLLEGLGLQEFAVTNLLPPLVSLLALPAFYLFALRLRLPSRVRLAALLAYATLPAAFVQQLEGGGLAEAFGSLALLGLALAALWAYRERTLRSHLLLGLAWALCVLSSPGSAYAALPTVLVLALAELLTDQGDAPGAEPPTMEVEVPPRDDGPVSPTEPRPRSAIALRLALAGVVALAASSPYWLTVLAHHGLAVFAAPFVAQHGDLGQELLSALVGLLAIGASGSRVGFLWSIVVLAGLAGIVRSRRWTMMAWFAALLLIPREGAWLAAPAVALLAGIGAGEVIGPAAIQLAGSRLGRAGRFAMALLSAAYLLWCPLVAIHDLLADPNRGPFASEIVAMEWVRENTPPDAPFIVLSGLRVQEWVPHIARRTVLNMPYGAEWEPEEQSRILDLEGRLDDCPDLACVRASVAETLGYEGVYVLAECRRLAQLMAGDGGEVDASGYDPLWQNDAMAVGRLAKRWPHVKQTLLPPGWPARPSSR